MRPPRCHRRHLHHNCTASPRRPPPTELTRRRQTSHGGDRCKLTRVWAGSAGATCIGAAAAPGGCNGAPAGAEKLGWNAGSGECSPAFAPCRAAQRAAVSALRCPLLP